MGQNHLFIAISFYRNIERKDIVSDMGPNTTFLTSGLNQIDS